MKLKFFVNLRFLFLIWFVFLFYWILSAQYYYYDSWTSTYPYQQWCSEDLNLRINTQGTWVMAWIFDLILDPTKISYSTSADATTLRSNLFVASTQTFINWTSLLSPAWKTWSNNTILNADRFNSASSYNWSNWLYWTIKFIPLYNTSIQNWSFSMWFDPDVNWCSSNATIETTLSLGWCDVINLSQQNSHLTWTYSFLQEPCVADTNNPTISFSTPSNWWDKQSSLSWISLSLNEAAWVTSSNVPYIWTGWHTIWTWNPGWTISNQYWIDLTTLSLVVSGNWNTKTFTWWTVWLTPTWNGRTWQDNYKSYSIAIDQAYISSYGIEKTITITTNVADRMWNNASQSILTFNNPISPSLLWTPSPVGGAIFVNLTAPIQLWIQDNRAWVDSGSIRVTLSWINGTNYGPYIFSGSSLGLSWIASTALQPNYTINITGHVAFPSSWTIKVIVYAEDMENNIDNISDYSFSTRLSCSELQCCENIYVQVWAWSPTLYSYTDLYINYASGVVPNFINWSATWYLDCRETYYGISIYSWNGVTWSFLSQFTWTQIVFSGTNIKAILTWTSWNVILLIRLWNFVIKVYPSSRVTSLDNLWKIIFYNQSKSKIYSWIISTNNGGTWSFLDSLNNIQAWTYYVVYKWQSQLSSYISWFVVVQNSWLMFLDFTTWTNIYGAQNYSSEQDDWNKYQTAWDLKNSQWNYDFTINWNDVSILVASWLFENWIDLLDAKNLNWDVALNASDISIIWTNFDKKDAWFFGWISSFLTW